MDFKTHNDDILAHIDSDNVARENWHVATQKPAADSLEARTAVSNSCITLFSFAGASLKVCFDIAGDNITVSVILSTPLGDVTLGKGVLNASNPTITIGGGFGGFKAEATISYNVSKSELTIGGKICAPIVGCESGSTTIKL